jgi:hypothetical protein
MRIAAFGRVLALISCFSIVFQGRQPAFASVPNEADSADVKEMPDTEGEALIRERAKAKPGLHSIGKYKVGFEEQGGFAPIEGLWGVGLSLVGPMDPKTEIRPNIGVYDMELENVRFEHDELKGEVATYYTKRKDWLAKQENGKWIRGLPYEVIRNSKNRIDGYRIGFEYELNGVPQVQTSYFLMCGKRMFHLKSLHASERSDTDGVMLSRVAESFRCESDSEKVGPLDRDEIRKNWRKAATSPAGRSEALRALRDFFLQYELEHQAADDPAIENQFEGLDARIKRGRDLLRVLLGFESAYAQAAEDPCFYAGWKSTWQTGSGGKRTCAEPSGLRQCGAGKLACNPSVFGNVCISEQFQQQATQVCHAQYLNDQAKHDQEIAELQKANPNAFQEVQDAADGLCQSEPYGSSNFSLCTSLYNRIAQIDPQASAVGSDRSVPAVDPENYQEAYETTQSLLQLVENQCMTSDKKSMHASVVVEGQTIDCVKARETALANLRALDKVNQATRFKEIQDNACEVVPPALRNLKQVVKAAEGDSGAVCTKEERARQGSCGGDILCAAASNLTLGFPIKVGSCDTHRDSCLVNAATAVINSLWQAVKGLAKLAGQAIAGLVQDAYRGAKNLAKGFLNFFGASYEIDDASSYKTVQFAKSSGGMIGDFIKAPGESIKKFMNGIWSGINDWMMKDAFCQEWSSAAHLSTCLKPASGWECLSCKQKINGTCAVMGYVASEIVAAFFTGGAVGAIKMTGVGARVTSILSSASAAGRLAKLNLAEKFPKLARIANDGKGFLRAAKESGRKRLSSIGGKIAEGSVFKKLKVLSGGVGSVIKNLEDLPLVRTGVKIVRLPGDQAGSFLKWYGDLNRKAFDMGQGMFRRPTRSGAALARMEAKGAKFADDGAEILDRNKIKSEPANRERAVALNQAQDAEKQVGRMRDELAGKKRVESEAQVRVNRMKKDDPEYPQAKRDLLDKKRSTKESEKQLKQAQNRLSREKRKQKTEVAGRVKKAEELLERPLNRAQKDALERSHMVGAGEAGKAPGTQASMYNYTPAQIRKKYQLLSDAGFNKAEIKKLMDNEVVGLFDGFLSNEQLASRWAKEIDQQVGDGVMRIRGSDGTGAEMHVVKIGDRYYQVNPESGSAYLITASELKDELIYIKQANGSLKVQPATGRQFPEIDPPFKDGDVLTHEHLAGAPGSPMTQTTGTVVAKGKGWVMLKTADGRTHFVPYNTQTRDVIRHQGQSLHVEPKVEPKVMEDREFALEGNVSSSRNEEFIRAEQLQMKNQGGIKPIGNSGFSLGDPILVQRSSGGQSKAIISKNLGDGKVEVKWVGPNGDKFEKIVSVSDLKSIEIKSPPAQPLPRIEAASPKAVESFQSHLSQLYAEHGYFSKPDFPFSQWDGPDVAKLPDQGWKMHVSMNPERATEIAETVLPELRKKGITHKIAKDLADFSKWEGTQAGKFITIYPRTDQEAREIARLISDALEKKGLKGSDFIPIKGEDVSGTGVYARYGRFTGGPLKDAKGNPIPGSKGKIMGPDGRLYEDIRGGPTPDWVRPLRD